MCYLRLDFETFTTVAPAVTTEVAPSTCPDTFKVTVSSRHTTKNVERTWFKPFSLSWLGELAYLMNVNRLKTNLHFYNMDDIRWPICRYLHPNLQSLIDLSLHIKHNLLNFEHIISTTFII